MNKKYKLNQVIGYSIRSNKKSQIASGISWIIAFIIIVFIMAIFLVVAANIVKLKFGKSSINIYSHASDLSIKTQLVAFLNTEINGPEGEKTINELILNYDKSNKKGESIHIFNEEVGKSFISLKNRKQISWISVYPASNEIKEGSEGLDTLYSSFYVSTSSFLMQGYNCKAKSNEINSLISFKPSILETVPIYPDKKIAICVAYLK